MIDICHLTRLVYIMMSTYDIIIYESFPNSVRIYETR